MNEKRICLQLVFPYALGVIAAAGTTAPEVMTKAVNEVLEPILVGLDKSKIIKRLARCITKITDELMNKQTKQINGHKFVLTIFYAAQRYLNDGGKLDQKILDLIDYCMTIEADMDKTHDGKIITDEDHEKLKSSAERASERVFEIIKNI